MQVSFWEVANTGTEEPGFYVFSAPSQLQGIEFIDPLPPINLANKILIGQLCKAEFFNI